MESLAADIAGGERGWVSTKTRSERPGAGAEPADRIGGRRSCPLAGPGGLPRSIKVRFVRTARLPGPMGKAERQAMAARGTVAGFATPALQAVVLSHPRILTYAS